MTVDPLYADGWTVVAGRGIPVGRLGLANLAGQPPDEIAADWDLSLAQVHAALSYFYANQVESLAAMHEYDAETLRLAKESAGSM